MFKRLSEAYAIPVAAVAVLSIAGLLAFCTVMGLATFACLVTVWPDMPGALAVAIATVVPLLFILGVGIVCATHDRWADNPTTAKWLKVLKLIVPTVVIVYLLFETVRPWL
jgi:hypothetical protein